MIFDVLRHVFGQKGLAAAVYSASLQGQLWELCHLSDTYVSHKWIISDIGCMNIWILYNFVRCCNLKLCLLQNPRFWPPICSWLWAFCHRTSWSLLPGHLVASIILLRLAAQGHGLHSLFSGPIDKAWREQQQHVTGSFWSDVVNGTIREWLDACSVFSAAASHVPWDLFAKDLLNLAMPGPRLLHVANPSCSSCRGALQKVDEDFLLSISKSKDTKTVCKVHKRPARSLRCPSMFEVLLAALVCLPGATLRPKVVLRKRSKIALEVCIDWVDIYCTLHVHTFTI